MVAGDSLNSRDSSTSNHTNTSVVGRLPGLIDDVMYFQMLGIIIYLDIIIGAFAVGANVITITAYCRMGFSDSTNISLTALAVSDLGIAVTTITTSIAILLPAVMSVPFGNDVGVILSAIPHSLLTRVSAFITTYVSAEGYLCVLLPLKVKSIITPKRTLIVMLVIYGSFLSVYPISFVRYPLGWRFESRLNRTIFDVLTVSDEIVYLFDRAYVLLIATSMPLLNFLAVVVFTILLALSLQKSKAWRDAQSNSAQLDGKSAQSAAKQSKEIRAVKMVITIAIVFIISSIPLSAHNFTSLFIPEFALVGRYFKLYDMGGMMSLGVNSINSGANVIIYYSMSKKSRRAVLGLFSTRKQRVK